MTDRFSDQIVLVTGGSAGIGRATALAFAREGATVVVSGRNEDTLKQTVDAGVADYIVADTTIAGDVSRLTDTIVQRHGRLDIAVNNAGILAVGQAHELAEEDFTRMMLTNVTGVFLSMQYQLRHMRTRKQGVIVNVGSTIGSSKALPAMGAYGASKAAVVALTKAAALENIGEGIRINSVSPGSSDTPMSMRPGEDQAARSKRVATAMPIGRVGSLEEVAGTILYLASEDAGFAVGHDLVIDGGASL